MKKTLSLLIALVATMTAFAQTNLTSGKTVVPLGGVKTYTKTEGTYTISEADLQKITTDGNTANVYLFPEGGYESDANKAIGIQGFYIDLGEAKSIGAIKSTWEGAAAGGNIYVTNTEPAADGTLTGETLIATFTNAQEGAKDAAVSVDNSGRYVVFVPTEATNYAWGVKIRTFAAFEKEASVLTTLEVSPSMVKVGEATELTLTAKDQVGLVLTTGVTYAVTSGNADLKGNTLTANAVGDIVITATYNGKTATATVKAINVSAPTENPTEPTDLAANVIAVYSAKYGKGLVDNNPAWGVGGGAPNPLYSSLDEVEIADGHKVVHVKGTGFNNRTAGGAGITTDYTKIYVALYPFTATEAKLFADNGYADAVTVDNLKPGEWNYVELDNAKNWANYILVELVGESEFYLDHFYFAKPAVDDNEAPVLDAPTVKATSPVSVTLTLKATDNKSENITYVVTDAANKTEYTAKGKSGEEIDFVVSPLEPNTEYTFSVVAKDDNENASDAQEVQAKTGEALKAAPAPEQKAENVKSIYSDTYTAATTYNYGTWGQKTAVVTESIEKNEALKLTNYDYLGFEFATDLDLSDMDYVHIDVLPLQNMDLGITPIMRGGTPTELPTSVGTLTVGEWNSKDIKLADLGLGYANFKAFQLKIDKGSGTDILYVDNIYFWKEEAAETEITSITVEAAATSIEVGKTTQLTVKDQNNKTVAADKVTFASNDEKTATVSEAGVVTAVAVGKATINATLKDNNQISNTVEITVTEAVEEPTSGEASATITSNTEGVNGKELKYTWAFTQKGMDVTVTFECTNETEITGIVKGYIHDSTDGFAETEGLTKTWENCTVGQVIKVAHKWMFSGGEYVTPVYTYTVKEATTPETGITALNATAAAESIKVGETTQITVEDQDKNTVDADKVTFESQTETVATVDEKGVVTAVAAGDAVILVTLKDNENVKTKVTITVTAAEKLPEAAETPEAAAADVLAIYSDKYEATVNLKDVGSGNKGSISDAGWNGGYGAVEEKTLATGDNAIKVTDAVCFGVQAGTADVTDYAYLNVAIYSSIDFNGNIVVEGTDMTGANALPISLKANQWNYVKANLSGKRTGATWIQMYVGDADNKNTIFVDNIYFSKIPAGELVIGEPNAQDIVAVQGDLTNDNKTNLTKVDAPIVDLSGANIAGDVTEITTGNPNAFIVVDGTVDNGVVTSATANQLTDTKNLIVKSGDYYFPVKKLELTDDENAPVWTDWFVSTGNTGYSYTREIPAGEYTTAYLPAATTAAVTGLTVYTFEDYDTTNGKIVLAEKADGIIPANTPVILHNTNATAVTITAEGTGDLNFSNAPASIAKNGVTLTGNYKIADINGEYVPTAPTASVAPAKARRAPAAGSEEPAVTAASGKTAPFRAYFTGLTQDTESVSTAIRGITVERAVNGEVYTLNGQKLTGKNLPKGIYILNGKKVIVK